MISDRLFKSSLLNTDSYKVGMWQQYRPGTEFVYSYIESRGGRYDEIVMDGYRVFIQEYMSTPFTLEDIEEADKRTSAVAKDNKQQAIMMFTFGLYLGATGKLPDFVEDAYNFNTEGQKNNVFNQSDAQRLIKLNSSILTQMDAHHKDTLAAVKHMTDTLKAHGAYTEEHAALAKETRQQIWELRKSRNALAETQRKLKKFRY